MLHLEGPIRLKGEVGVVEAVTAATATSVAVSAAFNIGYFSTLDVSLVSWMSVQDLVFGAAGAFIPTLVGAQLLTLGARSLEDKPSLRIRVFIGLGVALVVVFFASAISDWFEFFPNSKIFGRFVTYLGFSLFFGILFALGAYSLRSVYGAIVAALAAFSLPYYIGKTFYYNDISMLEPNVELLIKDVPDAIRGRLLKSTTNNTFLFDGNYVTAIRNDDIRKLLFLTPKGVK